MNQWYAQTYESILALANWQDIEVDVGKKIIGVFAWMPMTIMNLKMSGGRYRCNVYSLEDIQKAMDSAVEPMNRLGAIKLQELDFELNGSDLRGVVEPVVSVLGSVAASKYLHFSKPLLFPMWDAAIRKNESIEDSASSFIEYIEVFQRELGVCENLKIALSHYQENPIRGWDIEKMTRRST